MSVLKIFTAVTSTMPYVQILRDRSNALVSRNSFGMDTAVEVKSWTTNTKNREHRQHFSFSLQLSVVALEAPREFSGILFVPSLLFPCNSVFESLETNIDV